MAILLYSKQILKIVIFYLNPGSLLMSYYTMFFEFWNYKNVIHCVEMLNKGQLFSSELSSVCLQEKDHRLWNAKGRGRKAQLWDVT